MKNLSNGARQVKNALKSARRIQSIIRRDIALRYNLPDTTVLERLVEFLPLKKLEKELNKYARDGWQVAFQTIERQRFLLF